MQRSHSLLPHRGRKKSAETRAAGEKVMVLIPACSFQAETNYGAAKGGVLSEPGSFQSEQCPQSCSGGCSWELWQLPHQGLPKGYPSFCFPAHPSSGLCWAPGFLSIAGTLGAGTLGLPHSGEMGHQVHFCLFKFSYSVKNCLFW